MSTLVFRLPLTTTLLRTPRLRGSHPLLLFSHPTPPSSVVAHGFCTPWFSMYSSPKSTDFLLLSSLNFPKSLCFSPTELENYTRQLLSFGPSPPDYKSLPSSVLSSLCAYLLRELDGIPEKAKSSLYPSSTVSSISSNASLPISMKSKMSFGNLILLLAW
jgi:hypothetical protein